MAASSENRKIKSSPALLVALKTALDVTPVVARQEHRNDGGVLERAAQ
jgi:hypothetical protein